MAWVRVSLDSGRASICFYRSALDILLHFGPLEVDEGDGDLGVLTVGIFNITSY